MDEQWKFDAVAAVHDLIRRVTAAETALALIKTEWDHLEHTDRIRIGETYPALTDTIVRIPTR